MAAGRIEEHARSVPGARPTEGPTTVTVLTADESLVRSLSAWLRRDGYRVVARRRPESLAGVLSDRRNDAVLLDLRLPLNVRLAIGREIRAASERPTVPVIGLCDAELPHDARLAALRDGFWDVLELPGASAELVAKLGRWVGLKRDVDGLQACSLLDAETGHYTSQGIKRRLRELVALSQRTGSPLSCVVFGADRVPEGESLSADSLLEAGKLFSLALHHQTRNSDAVGRLEPLKFLVLAPNTPPMGAIRLAERFTSYSLSRRVDGEFPVTFSAGVAGVEGRNGQIQAAPELLLAAASRALNQARAAGAAQVAAAWSNVS
jgi:PleD family two-component response regulator